MRVVHLVCGFNQPHSFILLYMEWLLWQDCTNKNVYYYMLVVHLVCGFNQSHSFILLYMEWLLWQDCTNKNVYYYMRAVHLVCGFNESFILLYMGWQDCTNGKLYNYMRAVHLKCGLNQIHPFILFYLYVSRNGFDETAHMQIYNITFKLCMWYISCVVLTKHTLSYYFKWVGMTLTRLLIWKHIYDYILILYVMHLIFGFNQNTLSYYCMRVSRMALTRLRICKYISLHFKHARSASRVYLNRTTLSYYFIWVGRMALTRLRKCKYI